jgi:hypothetical protein
MQVMIIGAGNTAGVMSTRVPAGGHIVRLVDTDQAAAVSICTGSPVRFP